MEWRRIDWSAITRLVIGATMVIVGTLAARMAPAQAPAGGPPVSVARPVMSQVVDKAQFSGRFDALDSVQLRARVPGYLSEVGFVDGALVARGDLLFQIDRRPYEAAAAQAEAAVISARAQVEFTRGDLERYERLARQGASSDRTFEQARQAANAAQANLLSAQAQVTNARLNLEFTQIRAPISGRIGRRLITAGNLVAANDTLLASIVALDPIYFYFDIDERTYLHLVRQAQANTQAQAGSWKALITLTDEMIPPREAVLDFFDNRVDQATGTIRCRAQIVNADLFLTPGMFGRIELPISTPYDAVLVPDDAIGADLDRRFVYVVADGSGVRRQFVSLGPRHDGYRVIREGLTGAELVVVNGLQRIRPGVPVTPTIIELPQRRETKS